MPTDRIILKPLQDVARGSILELLRLCLGQRGEMRTDAFWRWKHEDNPFGESPGVVALVNGTPVALRLFLRWRFIAAGHGYSAVRAVDTATHPEWRRRGLFRRLTMESVDRLTEEEVGWVFNTPNPTSRSGYLKMGWRIVGPVPVGVRIVRPVAMLLSRRARLRLEPKEAGFVPAGEITRRADTLELVRAALAGEPRLHTDRMDRYLTWRYAVIPGIQYFAAREGAVGEGALIVFRLRQRGRYREATVSELLLGPGAASRRAAVRLLRRVVALGPHYVSAVSMPGSPERDAFRRAGFLPLPARRPVLTTRRLAGHGAAPDPGQLRHWRVSIGDLELF